MPLTPPTFPAASAVQSWPLPGVVTALHPYLQSGVFGFAANQGIGMRVVVGASGTLTDLAVYITTSLGNIDVGVYSTASPRVRLFSTGSLATPAPNTWTVVGALSLAVTAGDQLDFVIANDTGTAALAGFDRAQGNALVHLPANYLPALGASPVLSWTRAASFTLPATITDASISDSNTGVRAIMARVA